MLGGIRSAIVGLVLATAITMLLHTLFGIGTLPADYKGTIILVLLVVGTFGYRKLCKKAVSPIVLILCSGVLGVIFYL